MDRADATEERTTLSPFVFSNPSAAPELPRIVNFGIESEHVFHVPSSKVYTFAIPTIVHQYDPARISSQTDNTGRYKSKISKVTYAPTANMFASALKETEAFQQLKKNSRSRTTKININNSITCSNVPKSLVTKSTAKEYFTKYGNIVKVTIRPRKREIIVIYASKEEANVAYYSSGNYMGEKFRVEWTKQQSSTLKTKKSDLRKNIVENLLKASDNEIKSELEAMINFEYNLHSVKTIAEVTDANALLPAKVKKPASSKAIALLHDKPVPKLEKAAAKVEKLDTESPITKPLSNISMEELQNIIHQVALTAEDKYKVLEARDRLMRLKRVKPASLATAKVTSGTCPDMCPEKERLMRESQRQVAPYEQLEGDEYHINHAIAVKQYSRSSADQEEPMPHELRPVRSLKMTMSYLLHEIVDLCEEEGTNLAEWYHFLWDRTRGIRKDITQQELCCMDSVELIEQCARFHIVCSETLCAEDASVFDKKINSENLTKCLQTLKYMYHDLRVKGITCKNEPEFRAYIVLLNLNNGNFMYDLQQLPRSVQNSPEVKFAISVYFALDSNNYYKFFQLVRKTTYLNACILLRYFNQIRIKTLAVMVKAYCRRTSTVFPLYELIDILGFENENESRRFCEQAGLNVSNDEMHILLNRENFGMPAGSIQQSRACNLIASKRIALNFSIGQCIAGDKMPDRTYKNHKPHNSFDAHGNLLLESVNAADQNPDVSCSAVPGGFAEKETKRMPKLTSIRDKNQTDVSLMQIRKPQPINVSSESSVPKSVSVSDSVGSNISKTMKFEANTLTGHEQTMPQVFENKSQLIAQSKAISDEQCEAAATITTRCEDINVKIGKKQSTIFGKNGTFDSNLFANNSGANNFSKQTEEASRNAEPVTAFAIAASKSIFAGTKSTNLFARNDTPVSTVFANSRLPIPFIAQHSISTVGTATAEPSISRKEQKDAQTTSETEKARLEMLEHARKIQQIEEKSKEICHDLIAEVTHEFCSIIAKEEIDKIKECNALSERIAADTIDDIIREMCDIILTAEIDRHRRLQVILLRNKNRMIAKCFNAWRQYVLKGKQQREALEDTPVWLQKQSVEECAKMLYTEGQDVAIRKVYMCKRRSREPIDLTDGIENLAPIEFIAYNGIRENSRSLDVDYSRNVFWKLVISWPDLSNRPILWHHRKIMNEYFHLDDFTMEPIIKTYHPNQHETLHVCIRHFEGFINENRLIGTDALLFIADASEEYKSIARRLTRTVLSRHKLMPIPLVFLALGVGSLEEQNENIISDLESFLESGYVSEYTIMFEKNLTARVTLDMTQSAILWLTINRSPSNPLQMDYLHNIYDVCLSEELWLRILGDAMFNKQLSNAMEDPNFIIDLHNEAVNHLIDIILDPESTLYTSFAPEFKRFLRADHAMPCGYQYFDGSWKRDEYKAKLEAMMNNFVLRPWNAPWPITDAQNLRQYIMNYCREVLSDSNCNIVCCDILNSFSLTSDSLQMPNFVHVLLHVIREKMRLIDEDQMVIYNKNHIKHFRTLPWWFKSNVLTEFISRELNRDADVATNKPLKKRKRFDESEDNLDDSLLNEEFDSLAEFCENMNKKVMEVHFSSKNMDNLLQTQQSQNKLLEERLRNALYDEANEIKENR